jgi:hypothetical protein
MSALHKLDLEPRLVVALAIEAGRLRAQASAFLSGAGQDLLVAGDAAGAQALIADYDDPAGRAEVHRFLMQGQGPVAVLALSDPGLPGTLWVPKPVRDQALLLAAQALQARVQRRMLQAGSVDRPNLRLLPPSVRPLPIPPSPARKQPLGRALRGTFAPVGQRDWTSRIVWLALGALLIVAAANHLGWRPADENLLPQWPQSPAQLPQPVNADGADQRLREAIDEALRARPVRTSEQQATIDQELVDRQRPATAGPAGLMGSWLRWPLPSLELPRLAAAAAVLEEAGAPWQEQAEVRAALASAAQNASVETRGVD